MDIRIDASDITQFGAAMAAAPGTLQTELTTANTALLVEGVGLAQEYAPVKDGTLRGQIHIIDGPNASGGSYGIEGSDYAWQREEGGTIVPRSAKFLVFEWQGKLVFAKKVTQSGSHYMQQSVDALRAKVVPAYEKAVERVFASL